MRSERTYLPAAGKNWLLPLYDPLVNLFNIDKDREWILEHSNLKPGQTVLDLGCGTGSMMVQMGKLYPDVKIFGLDPDPHALALAQKKATIEGINLSINRGFSDSLPYPDNSFDKAYSTFMFHHLESIKQKEKTLAEVKRVLKKNGVFYLLDSVDAKENKIKCFFTNRTNTNLVFKHENSEAQIFSLLINARYSGWEKINERNAFFGRVISIKATI